MSMGTRFIFFCVSLDRFPNGNLDSYLGIHMAHTRFQILKGSWVPTRNLFRVWETEWNIIPYQFPDVSPLKKISKMQVPVFPFGNLFEITFCIKVKYLINRQSTFWSLGFCMGSHVQTSKMQ